MTKPPRPMLKLPTTIILRKLWQPKVMLNQPLKTRILCIYVNDYITEWFKVPLCITIFGPITSLFDNYELNLSVQRQSMTSLVSEKKVRPVMFVHDFCCQRLFPFMQRIRIIIEFHGFSFPVSIFTSDLPKHCLLRYVYTSLNLKRSTDL